MEDPSGSGSEVVVSSPAGAPKSKLDTLAKDDLIKFAKKQMSAMQKMKTTYADLEKEFEIFKQQSNASSNADESNLIQELTERMNVLLFEKAECQQSLLLSYKDLDRTKQLAKDELVMLQTQLDCLKEDHQRQMKDLQNSMEESSRQHQQELAQLQKLLTDYNQVGPAEEVLPCLEVQLKSLVSEMQASRVSGEGHQRDLALAQQEIENLREEVAQGSARHEEEMRALEEDCEMERERLLLLHDELTEQLALKDSYLQDVQEEDEEPVRGSGIAKMLELSGCSQGDSTLSEGEAAETSRLKAALEDLSAQNTMLQDELTLLRNLKGEFESELERTREEFQAEKEELEFKIDELLMTKESAPVEPVMTSDEPHPKVIPDCDRPKTGRELQATNAGNEQDVGQSLPSNAQGVEVAPSTAKDQMVFSSGDPKQETQELQKLNQEIQELQELRTQLEVLTKERNSAIAEFNNIREILQRLEKESGQRICPYDAMKEQGAEAVHKLHYKIEELSQEKSVLLKSIKEATQENIKKSLHDLELQLEASIIDIQPNVDCVVPPQVSVEGQTLLVGELTKQNEAILVQLQAKENEVQELGEIVSDLTTKRDAMQSQLQRHEEQLDMFYAERTKESQRLQDEKENELASLGQEMERKLQSLGKEKDAEIEHLREEKAKMEAALKEEARERQETVSSLEVTVRDFSAERDKLEDKLKEASFELSHVQEERNSFASKLTTYQIELDQDKCALEARLHSLTEGVEQSRDTIRVLKESNAEAAKHSAERVLDLETRIEELEREKSMLLSKIEDASEEKRLKDSWEELQVHVEDLEKERNMLRCNLEEVLRDTEQLQKDLEDMKYANEKMREENQKLYAHISEEEKGDGNTAMEDLEKQKRQLEEQLEERNCLVTKLCSDIAALQESDARSTSCEENVASQLTEQIALLEKDAKLKNEKMNKIKAVAVKAKKELDTSKKEVTNLKEEVESLKAERERVSSSMKDVIHAAESYKNLQMDYDGLTEQLDKEREVVEVGERHVAELTKQLSAAVSQKELLVSEKEDLLTAMVTLRSTVKQLEAYVKDISKHREGLEADLLAERTMKEHKVKELLSATKELEEMTAELGKLHKRSQQTSQEMEQLRKEAQQNSLLGMEMADYERLVKELNTKVSQGESSVAQLKELICTHVQSEDSLKQEIEALKSQMDQREEKASKMKQLLVKTKKDLAAAKKQNASNVMLQASLKGELENNQQQLEGCKIEVSELMAERHRLQEQLRCVTEQHQRAASALQQRISSLQREGEISKAELVSTTREFESYKVRVHNVLKQQKNKSSMQSEGEAGTMEREQLCSQVEQLRTRLVENQRTLQSSTAELQQLQSEHDTLLERHNKILQETVTKEAQLRERLLSVQSENISLRTEQAQTQAELQSQAEAQRMAFREQVRSLQDEHGSTVETLHGQLRRLEEQLFTLQSGSLSIQSTRRPQVSDLQRRNPDPGQGGPGCIDLQSTAREEGEGMETTETERCVPAHPPLPSLEHLLHSPDPKQEPFVWTVEPTKEELSQKLTTAARSMEHMNSLLHETEATNAVLMEQVTLLKSEVRRLERNQEREKSVSNMEYLKNVLLQFIFLRSGNERQALLPVMHTMLQLSPEEKSKLAAIAQGEEDVSASRGAGWTSYLHSWSGIR